MKLRRLEILAMGFAVLSLALSQTTHAVDIGTSLPCYEWSNYGPANRATAVVPVDSISRVEYACRLSQNFGVHFVNTTQTKPSCWVEACARLNELKQIELAKERKAQQAKKAAQCRKAKRNYRRYRDAISGKRLNKARRTNLSRKRLAVRRHCR